MSPSYVKEASQSNSWVFKESFGLLKHIGNSIPSKGFVLFSTGYGPSGLPHIGTFGEVVRTVMVQEAFKRITNFPTKLICFSDDKDAMRKVPDFISNIEEYQKYIGLPLSNVPDPFGKEASYAMAMNKKLCKFLDDFGFQYHFMSATECYRSGMLNSGIVTLLQRHQKVLDLMLPTLGEERKKTYSPFLPICKRTGVVLQVKIEKIDVEKNTVSYVDPLTNEMVEVSVLNGDCKVQWKLDLALRWKVLQVDFEMYGKDHLVNGAIYSKGCKIIDGIPPRQMYYELFLDENGEKISKTKANGITVEQWLKYGPTDSLAYLMYVSPTSAKRISLGLIVKYIDEYIRDLGKYFELLRKIEKANDSEKSEYVKLLFMNPVFYVELSKQDDIHFGKIDSCLDCLKRYVTSDIEASVMLSFFEAKIDYSMILNLIDAFRSSSYEMICAYVLKYIMKHNPSIATNVNMPHMIVLLIKKALNFYEDVYKVNKQYRQPSSIEKDAMLILCGKFEQMIDTDFTESDIQNAIYDSAKMMSILPQTFFVGLYETLLGTDRGPRLGSFFYIYGLSNAINLIKKCCASTEQ
ncbi:Lysine--tRNA ligase [Candidatus Fokinia solitaria]|uniref:Lysine--tRNA ligase n=1 Tax=Candidatus Fokinia solitaria TaxID=1802984 RepID=A0A2U8BRR2_9RICK|nr:lysine--tRNA ligase [Candidatus Fokinia solitaria]AWD33017.1 Lysine--tRNA ligase [Candidatus Fokinia solitaria]